MSAITEVEASSALKEVTVYENRAQLHRRAVVSLAAGVNRIVFGDLPKNIDRDSLQVGFEETADTASVVLRGIVFDTVTTANKEYDAQEAERRAATEKVTVLQRQLSELRGELDVVKQRQAHNRNVFGRAVSAESGSGKEVFEPQTWEALLAAYGSGLEAQLTEQRRLEDAITLAEQQLDSARQANSVVIPKDTTRSVVAVMLHAPGDVTKATLVISYLVEGASWESEYDVRVNSETLEMQVQYHAVIKQRTEEDWRDVHVTLSTARPSISGKQPELTPWRVDVVRAVKMRKAERNYDGVAECKSVSKKKESARREISDSEDEDTLEDYAAPAVETATVSEAATSVSFTVARLMTVLRDGEPTRAPLLTLPFTVTLHHATVPSAAEAVYASAKAKNTSDYPLAAGSASIFLDGQFVTRSSLPRTTPGEELEVSVGRDESVTVKRKMLNKRRSDEGGMWSSKRDVMAHSFVNTLRNAKKTPVTVKVRERVPVSDNSELVVTLVKPPRLSDEQKKKMEAEGIVEVSVVVAPNESIEVPLEFTVSAPADVTIYGM